MADSPPCVNTLGKSPGFAYPFPMPPERFELTLRDGSPVIVRPLIPGDRESLAEAYRRLSPEARYHRFWTHTGEVVGEKMLNQVLDQDPQQHMTWTVLDPTRDFPPLGGASWWRDKENPAQAELSAIVLDDDQGRGVGTLLLAVMWLTAFRAGIQQLIGYVQVENRQAAAWMRDCGAQGEYDGYKLIFRWDLENLDLLPETRAATELAAWLAGLSPEFLG
jgi:GNAT superfamily N-acetyltransferase